METYSGCILADSVGLGKTFTALAVVKYYELRNKSVLVLCPKKLADNWLNYNRNLKTNIFARDRFNYDVLCHTDLSRTSGESFGTPLNRINWGNYDLVVIDESHNFRNNDAYKDKETRAVVRQDVLVDVVQELIKDVVEHQEIDALGRVFLVHGRNVVADLRRHIFQLLGVLPYLVEQTEVGRCECRLVHLVDEVGDSVALLVAEIDGSKAVQWHVGSLCGGSLNAGC